MITVLARSAAQDSSLEMPFYLPSLPDAPGPVVARLRYCGDGHEQSFLISAPSRVLCEEGTLRFVNGDSIRQDERVNLEGGTDGSGADFGIRIVLETMVPTGRINSFGPGPAIAATIPLAAGRLVIEAARLTPGAAIIPVGVRTGAASGRS